MVDCFDVWQEHKAFYARGTKLERNLKPKFKIKQVSKKYVVNLCGRELREEQIAENKFT
jgi:hypothetical protein